MAQQVDRLGGSPQKTKGEASDSPSFHPQNSSERHKEVLKRALQELGVYGPPVRGDLHATESNADAWWSNQSAITSYVPTQIRAPDDSTFSNSEGAACYSHSLSLQGCSETRPISSAAQSSVPARRAVYAASFTNSSAERPGHPALVVISVALASTVGLALLVSGSVWLCRRARRNRRSRRAAAVTPWTAMMQQGSEQRKSSPNALQYYSEAEPGVQRSCQRLAGFDAHPCTAPKSSQAMPVVPMPWDPSCNSHKEHPSSRQPGTQRSEAVSSRISQGPTIPVDEHSLPQLPVPAQHAPDQRRRWKHCTFPTVETPPRGSRKNGLPEGPHRSAATARSNTTSTTTSTLFHALTSGLPVVLPGSVSGGRDKYRRWPKSSRHLGSIENDSDFEGSIGAPDAEVPRATRVKNGRRFACDSTSDEEEEEEEGLHMPADTDGTPLAVELPQCGGNGPDPSIVVPDHWNARAPRMISSATVPGHNLAGNFDSKTWARLSYSLTEGPHKHLLDVCSHPIDGSQRMRSSMPVDGTLSAKIANWWAGTWNAEWPIDTADPAHTSHTGSLPAHHSPSSSPRASTTPPSSTLMHHAAFNGRPESADGHEDDTPDYEGSLKSPNVGLTVLCDSDDESATTLQEITSSAPSTMSSTEEAVTLRPPDDLGHSVASREYSELRYLAVGPAGLPAETSVVCLSSACEPIGKKWENDYDDIVLATESPQIFRAPLFSKTRPRVATLDSAFLQTLDGRPNGAVRTRKTSAPHHQGSFQRADQFVETGTAKTSNCDDAVVHHTANEDSPLSAQSHFCAAAGRRPQARPLQRNWKTETADISPSLSSDSDISVRRWGHSKDASVSSFAIVSGASTIAPGSTYGSIADWNSAKRRRRQRVAGSRRVKA